MIGPVRLNNKLYIWMGKRMKNRKKESRLYSFQKKAIILTVAAVVMIGVSVLPGGYESAGSILNSVGTGILAGIIVLWITDSRIRENEDFATESEIANVIEKDMQIVHSLFFSINENESSRKALYDTAPDRLKSKIYEIFFGILDAMKDMKYFPGAKNYFDNQIADSGKECLTGFSFDVFYDAICDKSWDVNRRYWDRSVDFEFCEEVYLFMHQYKKQIDSLYYLFEGDAEKKRNRIKHHNRVYSFPIGK